MHKLIIFSALIACALATWGPANKHEGQHPHQSIATHGRGMEHVKRNGMVNPGHNSRTPHGQLESVHHGGGTLYKNKEFRRTKKGQHEHEKSREERGRNHLRRLRSDRRQ